MCIFKYIPIHRFHSPSGICSYVALPSACDAVAAAANATQYRTETTRGPAISPVRTTRTNWRRGRRCRRNRARVRAPGSRDGRDDHRATRPVSGHPSADYPRDMHRGDPCASAAHPSMHHYILLLWYIRGNVHRMACTKRRITRHDVYKQRMGRGRTVGNLNHVPMMSRI